MYNVFQNWSVFDESFQIFFLETLNKAGCVTCCSNIGFGKAEKSVTDEWASMQGITQMIDNLQAFIPFITGTTHLLPSTGWGWYVDQLVKQ